MSKLTGNQEFNGSVYLYGVGKYDGTGTISSSNYCQNIKIGLGVKGTSSSNMLQIDITSQIGATASVTYQPANSQIINI